MHKQHRLSLAYLTVQGCPPVEQVRCAAAAGYDSAGLRLIAPHGLELAHPTVGDKALIREIRTTAADLGISFLDGEVFTLLPETVMEPWLPVIETAAEFGMPLMQITSEDPELSRASDNLGRIADIADKHGIAIAIEFMRWRSAATIENAGRLATARPNEDRPGCGAAVSAGSARLLGSAAGMPAADPHERAWRRMIGRDRAEVY